MGVRLRNLEGERVESVFRREAGRITATLTRQVGIDHVDLVEDAVQEALLKGLEQWRFRGIPCNPIGWLLRVARNHLLDSFRRDRIRKGKQEAITEHFEFSLTKNTGEEIETDIEDDQLRMMFVCCHPSISQESQISLILKILCGLSSGEIARAFLSNEETINKRLVRAKRVLREQRIELEIPASRDLPERLTPILRTLYLLFNEGYNSSHGEQLIRKDLCDEAIYLTRVLGSHPIVSTPSVHALLALMLLQRSRFSARITSLGELTRLEDQDRSLWDGAMIAEGIRFLDLSAAGEEMSEYHLQAGIAACHCLAKEYANTDWKRILALYDLLKQINDSPVVSLNRAVVVAKIHGPAEGIRIISEIRKQSRMKQYYLLHAVLGEFYLELKNFEDAARCYREALRLTEAESEKGFLSQRLQWVDNAIRD